ncbi:hypothetical protein JXJ21_07170 [candidate division KSB1 bacterium]|nr:hypothetical protein [candidate division KSB1 bacterium]
MTNDKSSKLSQSFHKLLNQHGYNFQFSLLSAIIKLSERDRNFPWEFEISEFPVEHDNFETKIDFLLSRTDKRTQLICECKRANPSLSDWCFVRAPIIHRHQAAFSPITIDRVEKPFADMEGYCIPAIIKPSRDVYHIYIELKTDKQGDSIGQGRGAINDAITQVIRGVVGYTNFLIQNGHLLTNVLDVNLIPIIFTTANLWTSSSDLSQANLDDGNLDTTRMEELELQKFVWVQYHLSNSLQNPNLEIQEQLTSIQDNFEYYSLRTIAIVNSKHVEEFLHYLDENVNYIKKYHEHY